MYNGLKRERQKINCQKMVDKFQMLTNEEVESNGIISKQMVFKTKKFQRDKTITWRDFEIGNLMAAGIDPRSLPNTILPADIDTLHSKAASAEAILDRTEVMQFYRNEQLNEQANEPANEQTQQ